MSSVTSLNSIRLLTQRKIDFTLHEFPDSIHSAVEVANFVGLPAEQVYKTLVVLRQTPKAKPMLIMVPADSQLNLKQVAKAVREKKVQMAAHKEAEQLTGLQTGGISALALLNRGFDIYLDQTAQHLARILISAGKRGLNVELAVSDLVKVSGARWIEAT